MVEQDSELLELEFDSADPITNKTDIEMTGLLTINDEDSKNQPAETTSDKAKEEIAGSPPQNGVSGSHGHLNSGHGRPRGFTGSRPFGGTDTSHSQTISGSILSGQLVSGSQIPSLVPFGISPPPPTPRSSTGLPSPQLQGILGSVSPYTPIPDQRQVNSSFPGQSTSYLPPRSNGNVFGMDIGTLMTAIEPGPVFPTNDQLFVAHGYGIRRGNGYYTSLIPADSLPPHVLADLGIANRQGPEGLIIVPEPIQPSRAVHPIPRVHASVIARLPRNGSSPPASTSISAQDNSERFMSNSFPVSPTGTGSTGPTPPRRSKVYCDKWIHEGTCAFTQVGCRYKHEMPTDLATLRSLGLRGIPNWYRQSQAVVLRTRSPARENRTSPASSANMHTPPFGSVSSTTGPESWRRQMSQFTDVSGGGVPRSAGATSSTPRSLGYGFGPIAPPSQREEKGTTHIYSALTVAPTTSRSADIDPFNSIKEEGEIDSDDDVLLFRGRSPRGRY